MDGEDNNWTDERLAGVSTKPTMSQTGIEPALQRFEGARSTIEHLRLTPVFDWWFASSVRGFDVHRYGTTVHPSTSIQDIVRTSADRSSKAAK